MGLRVFAIEFVHSFTLVLDDKVIQQVDDEWRKTFYAQLYEPEEIAHHIAYNVAANHLDLSWLDGFANLPDHFAQALDAQWAPADVREIKDEKEKARDVARARQAYQAFQRLARVQKKVAKKVAKKDARKDKGKGKGKAPSGLVRRRRPRS